ncbi:MurR/RpiR family transcriptional regulator [Rheinheimera texasensis]|uniref:MurR/RpiR family transcriptional regulator n=1 Tax=Rheinheimera texasensis TaxID=306205 RepID=UPI0032B12E7E
MATAPSTTNTQPTATQPAATQAELEQQISSRFSSLSDRLQVIGRYLLDQPQAVALGTAASIAQAAGVHASALVRFANAFAFTGFSELQQLYKTQLLQNQPDYQQRIAAVQQDHSVPADSAGLNYLQQISSANQQALNQLCQSIDASALSAATSLLAKARLIHLQGARRAFPVVSYASYLLGNTGLAVHLFDGTGYMQQSALNLLGADDVLLAVSFAPYAAETQTVVQRAKAVGCKVLLITDSRVSPLYQLADHTLLVREAELHAFRSLSASMSLVQALVLGLIHDHLGHEQQTPEQTNAHCIKPELPNA